MVSWEGLEKSMEAHMFWGLCIQTTLGGKLVKRAFPLELTL